MDWHGAYASGETGWDLWGMTPPLLRLLASPQWREHGAPVGSRVAVPGCGRGHDLRAWARAGYAPTGFDLVPAVVAEARQLLRLNRVHGAEVLCRDVLALPEEFPERFDLVYDYTCLCALPPDVRAGYAACMAAILRPGGRWLGLFFPLSERIGNRDRPPYLLDDAVLEQAFGPHFRRIATWPAEDSPPLRAGAERWELWERR